MPAAARIVERLSSLFDYPGPDFVAALGACEWEVSTLGPGVVADFESFAAGVRGRSMAQLQELYTETFDLNASCTLDLGWHLFGEQYERGAFLADLRPELQAAGIEERHELPDYFPYLLRLIDKAEPQRATALRHVIQPAVETLEAGLRDRQSPYEYLVKCAFAAVSRGA
jgi:nitrate reductase molybdenum cofactor assembly chaperone